eukprot:17547-Heterococcus_DN1.PRE.1
MMHIRSSHGETLVVNDGGSTSEQPRQNDQMCIAVYMPDHQCPRPLRALAACSVNNYCNHCCWCSCRSSYP